MSVNVPGVISTMSSWLSHRRFDSSKLVAKGPTKKSKYPSIKFGSRRVLIDSEQPVIYVETEKPPGLLVLSGNGRFDSAGKHLTS